MRTGHGGRSSAIATPYTGYLTTGHEWNGIKELNTPVPRPVYFFLALAFLFSRRLLGADAGLAARASPTPRGCSASISATIVAASLKEAAADRDVWTRNEFSPKALRRSSRDPQLMNIVRETGHALFGDNCAACHGLDAKGGPGFPNLTTSSLLWGGNPEHIFNTIRVGINSGHPDTHVSQMPAFGHDQMLPRADILKVSPSSIRCRTRTRKSIDPKTVEAGKAIFAANCVACHGEDAKGNPELGAPDLTDPFWIYGGDLETIDTTVWGGRQGHMPTWESRLSALDRKILTLYLLDKRTVRAMSDVATTDARRAHGAILAVAGADGGRCDLLVANAHLIYVATTSQPACVAHVRQSNARRRGARPVRAAQSSCSPLPTERTGSP